MSTPTIAIVGRPNVGKSTLYNCLTKTRDALVLNTPGVTRDRQFGQGRVGLWDYWLVDTGGLGEEQYDLDHKMAEQSLIAINDADSIIFVVDGRAGITAGDEIIAEQLRHTNKPIKVVVNKAEGLNSSVIIAEFYSLGMGEPIAVSASHRQGILDLIESLFDKKEQTKESFADDIPKISDKSQDIKVAIVGRPNVGKSTLTNRMLGQSRLVVFDEPGTTRDSIYIPLSRHGKQFTLIDTAGVRRRSKVHETLEKFSVMKTLKAIKHANVVIVVIDGTQVLCDQDLSLISSVLDAGRGLVIAVNKWDGLSHEAKQEFKMRLHKLDFVKFAKVQYISALHGTGVGTLFDFAVKSFNNSFVSMETAQLTKILEKAIAVNSPPMVRGRRIKLRYAHCGGHNPPRIVIHGKKTKELPANYKKYLLNTFAKALNVEGTPIRLEFRTGENPYEGKRNKLSPRQMTKRKRMIKYLKSKKK